VIAFRTDVKNEIRAAYKFVTISKRNQKSTLPVPADQKFFHSENPFARAPFCNGERRCGWLEI